jgi:hypothetical protein
MSEEDPEITEVPAAETEDALDLIHALTARVEALETHEHNTPPPPPAPQPDTTPGKPPWTHARLGRR